MRKLMITASLAVVAMASLAACADNSVKPGSSQSASTPTVTSAPPTTSAAEQTKQVCTDAAAASTTAAMALQPKLAEFQAASGDQAKMLAVGTDVAKIGTEWASKLTALAAKPIDPDVKAALTEGATTIQGLMNPATIQSLTPAAATTTITGVVTKINTACAGA